MSNKIIEISHKTLGIIVISQKYGNHTALIDKEDYDIVKNFTWCLTRRCCIYDNKFYIMSKNNQKTIFLHKLILNSKKQIDHINGNSLDNRKENLRVCTNQQNSFNRKKSEKLMSSKYKGVSRIRSTNKWGANIMFNGKAIKLGSFKSEEEAALAYNKAAIKYFGEFAYINIIDK